MYHATNDHSVMFLRVKHHSEKLVMLELTNHILPEGCLAFCVYAHVYKKTVN